MDTYKDFSDYFPRYDYPTISEEFNLLVTGKLLVSGNFAPNEPAGRSEALLVKNRTSSMVNDTAFLTALELSGQAAQDLEGLSKTKDEIAQIARQIQAQIAAIRYRALQLQDIEFTSGFVIKIEGLYRSSGDLEGIADRQSILETIKLAIEEFIAKYPGLEYKFEEYLIEYGSDGDLWVYGIDVVVSE